MFVPDADCRGNTPGPNKTVIASHAQQPWARSNQIKGGAGSIRTVASGVLFLSIHLIPMPPKRKAAAPASSSKSSSTKRKAPASESKASKGVPSDAESDTAPSPKKARIKAKTTDDTKDDVPESQKMVN